MNDNYRTPDRNSDNNTPYVGGPPTLRRQSTRGHRISQLSLDYLATRSREMQNQIEELMQNDNDAVETTNNNDRQLMMSAIEMLQYSGDGSHLQG